MYRGSPTGEPLALRLVTLGHHRLQITQVMQSEQATPYRCPAKIMLITVLCLFVQGRPYIAVQARLPYKDDAIHTVLELAPEDAELPSEGLAYLEVIRQVRRQ